MCVPSCTPPSQAPSPPHSWLGAFGELVGWTGWNGPGGCAPSASVLFPSSLLPLVFLVLRETRRAMMGGGWKKNQRIIHLAWSDGLRFPRVAGGGACGEGRTAALDVGCPNPHSTVEREERRIHPGEFEGGGWRKENPSARPSVCAALADHQSSTSICTPCSFSQTRGILVQCHFIRATQRNKSTPPSSSRAAFSPRVRIPFTFLLSLSLPLDSLCCMCVVVAVQIQ